MLKYLIYLVLCFTILISCKKETLETYSGDSFVYMQSLSINSDINRTDTLNVDFSKLLVDTATAYLTVTTVGKVFDYNRGFKLNISALNNADNYFSFDTTSFYIPADTNKIIIPININNKSSLMDTSCLVMIEIVPNEYFRTDFKLDYTGYLPSNYTKKVLVISNIAKPPLLWTMYYNYLGIFTRKKFQLMLEVIQGLEAVYFDSAEPGYGYPEATIRYIGIVFQDYLNQMAAAGQTIYEDDGTVMVMGPDVQ